MGRNPLLWLGLRLADLLARVMPGRVAYALADLAGRTWYRSSPARRAVERSF